MMVGRHSSDAGTGLGLYDAKRCSHHNRHDPILRSTLLAREYARLIMGLNFARPTLPNAAVIVKPSFPASELA